METRQPVDKDDSHNDHTDNDHCDCDNLVEDNHEIMTTGRLSTVKRRTMMWKGIIYSVLYDCGYRWLIAGSPHYKYIYAVNTEQIGITRKKHKNQFGSKIVF